MTTVIGRIIDLLVPTGEQVYDPCSAEAVNTIKEPAGICPDCNDYVDEDDLSVNFCSYSPQTCSTCHGQPCDGSC